MTKKYAQIVKQIKKLQLEAEKLRRNEIDGVVTRIREAISFYQLSADDLGLNLKAKGPAAKAAAPAKRKKRKAGVKASKAPKAPKTTKPPKYGNGAGGTWAGIGKRPNWLREALSSGRQLSEFEIK